MQRTPSSLASVFAAASSLALALTAAPRPAAAQVDLSIGPFLSYERLVLNEPVAAGLDLTGFMGPIGLRGSFAVPWHSLSSSDANDDPWYDDPNATRRDWSADGDLLLRLAGSGGGRSPYVYGFLGLGVLGHQVPSTSGTIDERMVEMQSNWSYGGGVSVPLGMLAITGEARYRRPYSTGSGFNTNYEPSREFRLGLSLRFGGSRAYGSRTTRRSSTRGLGTIAEVFPDAIPAGIPSPGSSAPVARARVIPTAERYLGVPYVWGGESPRGFDCSGFVQYVFAKHGVRLPRTSRQQAQTGTKVASRWSAVSPGDLVMFANKGQRISHVAIYAGNNRIIHATSSGGEVRYDDLDTRRGQWFAENMVAARRVTPDARGLLLDLARGFAAAAELRIGDLAPRP